MECQLGNATVHYEVFGEGRPLIALHGATCDGLVMAQMVEPVFNGRRGWKRIYPDLPGCGATSSPVWMENEDQLVEMLLDFIDRVIPGERFALAGISRGGYYAQGILYHRLAQIDGLALLVPVIRRDSSQLPRRTVLVRDEAALAKLDEWDRNVAESYGVVLDRISLRWMESTGRLWQMPRKTRSLQRRIRIKRNFSFPVDELPQPFEKPAVFILGRQDHASGYRDAWQILENLPRATFAVLDRAGHFVGGEQETLFLTLMNEWLDRVEESARA